jgi:hypothetical protein
MKYYLTACFFGFLFFITGSSFAQFKRVDSTVKIGKVGYRVQCNNKSDDKNQLSIKPIGFDNAAHEMSFYIKGRVAGVAIEDLNNDNFPDLLVYMYSGENGAFGTVYAFMSEENKSISPVPLPDVMLDGKLKDGYKGHDEFSLLEGSLIQKFPLYKAGDEKDKPTGGKRVIQYNITHVDGGIFKFKILRSYDTK